MLCWPLTNSWYVRIGACLNLKQVVIGVRRNVRPSCHSHVLSKYTTMAMMAMTAVILSSSNVWVGVVFTLDEQEVRLYWCVLKFEASRYWCSMQCEVVMPLPCAVQIHYNGDDGDDGCNFIFVQCMGRCCFHPG